MSFTTRHNASLAVGLAFLVMAGGCRQLLTGHQAGLESLLPVEADEAGGEASALAQGESEALTARIAAAQSLAQRDKPQEAIDAYLEIVQNHRVPAYVYQRLARLYHDQDQFDQSARYFLAALQIEPENAELLCDYGYSRYLQGDLVVAEQVLQRALEIDPRMARAHNNLGLVLAGSGNREKAEAEFRRAGCSRSEARENLACAQRTHESRAATGEQADLADGGRTAGE